jgi:hypothetical protein
MQQAGRVSDTTFLYGWDWVDKTKIFYKTGN